MDKELIRQGRNLSVLIAGPLRTKHIHKSIITRPAIASAVGRGITTGRTDGQPLIFWPPPPPLVRNMHVVIWEKSGRFIFTAAVARQADSRTIFLAKSTATALRSQSSVTVSIATARALKHTHYHFYYAKQRRKFSRREKTRRIKMDERENWPSVRRSRPSVRGGLHQIRSRTDATDADGIMEVEGGQRRRRRRGT